MFCSHAYLTFQRLLCEVLYEDVSDCANEEDLTWLGRAWSLSLLFLFFAVGCWGPPSYANRASQLSSAKLSQGSGWNGRAKRKKARRPIVHCAHCRLLVNLRELYLSMEDSGKNSRKQNAAKSLGLISWFTGGVSISININSLCSSEDACDININISLLLMLNMKRCSLIGWKSLPYAYSKCHKT